CVYVFYYCNNNTIARNTAENNYAFTRVSATSNNNKIINNTSLGNRYYSIQLSGSDNTTIIGNTFSSFNYAAISLLSSDSSTIQNNRFWSTVVNQAISDSSYYNTWDNGTHGNYYGDYQLRYPDATNDGVIWDTPYAIGGSSGEQDAKPLVWAPVNTAPSIDAPTTANYTHATTGHSLSWTIHDSITGITWYWLYKDGVLVKNGSWTPITPVSIAVDGLALGSYNYTIIVTDGYNGTANHTTVLTVLNAMPVLSSPVDITCMSDSYCDAYWRVTDASIGHATFIIYHNGSAVYSSTWRSGDIIYCNPPAVPGTWIVKIVVNDGLGGTASDEVIMTIIPRPMTFQEIVARWLPGIVLAFLGIVALAGLLKATKGWWQGKAKRVPPELDKGALRA
ncbi:MAG: NosD domain-containing protein, partial [Candidatus Sigynarchaeota archaeon]